MNRHELADLLAQTQSSMNAFRSASTARNINNSCDHPTATQPDPLSPRQRFQSHVRTLSQDSPSSTRNTLLSRFTPSPSSSPSPTLQHTSSLRVQPSSRDASRPPPTWRYSDPTLHRGRLTQYEPQFITEEREAWSRTSPFHTRHEQRQQSEDAFILQPPQEESPIQQPSKQLRELKPFSPSLDQVDVNERPKTSRGSNPGLDTFQNEDQSQKTSRFVEGSMSARSTGISSTWIEHGSVSTMSEDEENEPTPRPSPQRSSIDIDEFKPAAVTPGTFKHRLAKIGSAFKSHNHRSKPEAEVQNAKKKKGLRKSMSMWNIHSIGEKMRPTSGSTLDLTISAANPEKKATTDHNLEVLNDRKRRAEEAYAQQFGTKKRKSNADPRDSTGQRPLDDQTVLQRGMQPYLSSRGLRRSSSVLNFTNVEYSDSNSDIDRHKRPSRRELEKENQQLRALLKQQQEAVQTRSSSNSTVPEHRAVPASKIPTISETSDSAENTAPKLPAKKKSSKTIGRDVPPVPSLPDRVALKTLSNARNQARNANTNASSSSNNGFNSNVNQDEKSNDNANPSKRLVPSVGLSRPVSMILEEDEEGVENRTPGKQSLTSGDVAKFKQLTPSPVRLQGVKKEQWEWPEDVF